MARHVAQRLEMHRRPLELARDLSDKQLAAMPPRGLAVLGDCLLRDLDEKRYGSIDEACTMSQQFVRVLTARGTDAGSIDYLMRGMHRADRAGDVLVGPARLAFTRATGPDGAATSIRPRPRGPPRAITSTPWSTARGPSPRFCTTSTTRSRR
ncbi:MAG: hypothetical protein EB084_24980 [Proteobacteria bacterium]|nr:hypothetical protein [Pseudomonadota bacterium]